jgi:tetratricopeptide (TPR) repeat protein
MNIPLPAAATRSAVALLSVLVGPRSTGAQQPVPLYQDLGDYHYEVTTSVPRAQLYFDQGLRLYYAFNHAEAIRSFGEAQRLDPDCAMCWWGEALAWGPNINLPMDSASAVAAHAAVQHAVAVRGKASARERSVIDALAKRYEAVPPADRAYLDQAYADAMAEVDRLYPSDPQVSTLFAEALMDQRPWDYWTAGGEPQPGIAEALARLESVMARDPDHPGACHFFIHAVEKVYPERAVPCAERLAALMPGAGHLVHMPGHIYIRVGRYREAVEANQHAVHADETFIRDQRPGVGMYTAGYYPHNYDFLAFANMMIGRSEAAISVSDKVIGLLPAELFGSPGMDFLQHWSVRPLQMRVRFSRWDEILSIPRPPASFLHATAVWRYARGRAFAAQGHVSEAQRELEQLRTLALDPALDELRMEFNASGDLLGLAERVLTGWTEAAAGRWAEAVQALREAVAREDALLYGEPPEWSVPTRQDLGAVLLAAGRAREAEQAFRDDLSHFPGNGWSLRGLTLALQAQGKDADSDSIDEEFRRVWANADVAAPAFGIR